VERAVVCLWTRDVLDGDPAARHTVVPDNCADIILRIAPDGAIGAADVVGPMSLPVVVPELRAGVHLGVRFRPGWAPSLFRVAGRDLRDLRIPLWDVWPALARDLAQVEVRRPDDAVAAFGRVLGAYLGQRTDPPAAVRGALARLEATRGRLPITELCSELRVTRQHLARLFDEHVGLRPKFVARVARLHHVMERARQAAAGAPSWSALAFEAGYADQSHLIGDFTELTGAPPAAWLTRG
jgi:AraC-like DNA-binding protein